MRTFDYERSTTAAGLLHLWLWGEGLGPVADLAEAHRGLRAFCNSVPTVGVPSRRELVDGLFALGCRVEGFGPLREEYAAYRRPYGVSRREFVDELLRLGRRVVLPDGLGDPVVGP